MGRKIQSQFFNSESGILSSCTWKKAIPTVHFQDSCWLQLWLRLLCLPLILNHRSGPCWCLTIITDIQLRCRRVNNGAVIGDHWPIALMQFAHESLLWNWLNCGGFMVCSPASTDASSGNRAATLFLNLFWIMRTEICRTSAFHRLAANVTARAICRRQFSLQPVCLAKTGWLMFVPPWLVVFCHPILPRRQVMMSLEGVKVGTR